KKFQATIENSNPQRKEYLKDLLKEYVDAEEVFLTNQATEMMIMNPDTKIEQVHTWLGGKMKNKKAMDLQTNEWLTDVLVKYQNAKTKGMAEDVEETAETEISDEEYNDFVDNNSVSPERLNEIAQKVKNNSPLTE